MYFIPKEVIKTRQDAIRKKLAREGYKGYITLTSDNFLYLSGFFLDVQPWERPVALVIPFEGEAFMIMNELSTNHVKMSRERETLGVNNVYFYSEHPSSTLRNYLYINWTELLADKLKYYGIDRGTIATDSNYSSINSVKNYLPKVDFVAENEWLVLMRTVKCQHELDLTRKSAVLADYAQEVWKDLVKVGKYVKVVDHLTAAEVMHKGAELYPGANISVYTLGLSGPPSASPHGNSDATIKFNSNDTIVNIFVTKLGGYVVENERTYILGEPSALQIKAHKAASNACIASSDMMVAGNIVSSIDSAAQAVYEKAGFGEYINHRTGHGIGLAGHEFPHDVAFNQRRLLENEVWSAEPGIYIYGVGGFRQDNTVIVGKDKPEIITKTSLELEDLIISI